MAVDAGGHCPRRTQLRGLGWRLHHGGNLLAVDHRRSEARSLGFGRCGHLPRGAAVILFGPRSAVGL